MKFKTEGYQTFGIFVFVLLFAFACTYQLDEINYKEIPTPEFNHLEGIEIEVNSSYQDTFYLRGTNDYRVSIITKNLDDTPSFSKIDIDNKSISLNYSSGRYLNFTLSANNFSTGHQEMIITSFFKTKSGSIADNLELETVSRTFSKTFIMDNEPFQELQNIKTDIVDSTLTLSWDLPMEFGVDNIELTASGMDYNWSTFNNGNGLDTTIISPSAGEWKLELNEYLGGMLYLYLAIDAKGVRGSYTETATIYRDPFPELTYDSGPEVYVTIEGNIFKQLKRRFLRRKYYKPYYGGFEVITLEDLDIPSHTLNNEKFNFKVDYDLPHRVEVEIMAESKSGRIFTIY